MFTLINTILLVVLIIQVVKCRRDVQEIDYPYIPKKKHK